MRAGINPAPTDLIVGEGFIPSHRMLPPRDLVEKQVYASGCSDFEFLGAGRRGGLIGVCCPRLGGGSSEFGMPPAPRAEFSVLNSQFLIAGAGKRLGAR
jgi:hypothetical protein